MIIQGELLETPKLKEQGEGTQYYTIRWQLKGNDKVFYLRDCAFEKANNDSILQLLPGTKIEFRVKESEYEKKEKVNVYSVSVRQDEDMLSLDEFNQCYSSYWKRLLPFVIIAIGLLVYSVYFVNKRKSNLKKSG